MRFEGSFPAVGPGVGAIRRRMAALARECGLDERAIGDVALAVSEAATNVVVHAYAEAPGSIHVTADHAGGELTIVIADDGPGLVPRTDSPGLGLGLPIIASVVRRLEVVTEGGGTQVHMVFDCPSDRAA
ncbi:MAG: putative anti-sigma regulatory factor, serine/threonine protein kinase [Solirubrobacteraceae bacterium]|nr:putative anti-sigma regulatory factor, serine/threonine protein kinase [Solirubrobacteraceae bacterium]